MKVELIRTGTELLLGQILNTNAQFLSRRLNSLGFSVLFHSTVGDNRARMTQVLQVALGRADIVITSGGLGPTQGDITKEVASALLGRNMTLHRASQDRIAAFFRARGIAIVGFTGQAGGKLAPMSDVCFRIPSNETPRIQEGHEFIGHLLCALIEAEMFPREAD